VIQAIGLVFLAGIPAAWLALRWQERSRAGDEEPQPPLARWLLSRLREDWLTLVLLEVWPIVLVLAPTFIGGMLVGLADSLLGHMK